MTRLKSSVDLRKLREIVRKDRQIRADTGTRIVVGMGTCGIAAGAQETRDAIVEELQKRGLDVDVTTVGCIGMCSKEPLVDIQQAGMPRITYCNVHPDMVARLIDDHLLEGSVVNEWAMGRVPNEGIGQSR
jgi:NADP-reducing hydrogenase subunit HndB